MIEWLDRIDKDIFLFLNGLHNEFLDPVMFALTGKWYWMPLFLLVTVVLFVKFKWRAVYILLGIALVITLADQFTSRFMKPFFERFRPSHDPDIGNLVHTVNNYKGGLYGFASSHAANSFGVAFYLWFTVRKHLPWIWIMFIWGAIFSYTRIYLGVHYPGDIITGAFVGSIFGYVAARLTNRLGMLHS